MSSRTYIGMSPKEISDLEDLDRKLLTIRKKTKFPDVMYHVTDRRNVESILKQGLVVGSTRMSGAGSSKGVYLTDDPSGILREFDINFKDPVLIQVDTRGLDLRFDPEWYFGYEDNVSELINDLKNDKIVWAAYSVKDIPVSRLKIRTDSQVKVIGDVAKFSVFTNRIL